MSDLTLETILRMLKVYTLQELHELEVILGDEDGYDEYLEGWR